MSNDAEARLETFIARFTPDIAARVRACRAVLRARLPTAIELVYDNYNALAIGLGASEKLGDVLFSLAVYPRDVLLFFYYGASLPDPESRLAGSGTRGRHVRLTGPEMIAEPAVDALIAAAIAFADRPLPPPGEGGYLVIKSISPNQRSRRPAGGKEGCPTRERRPAGGRL